jgi:hypothetical protein
MHKRIFPHKWTCKTGNKCCVYLSLLDRALQSFKEARHELALSTRSSDGNEETQRQALLAAGFTSRAVFVYVQNHVCWAPVPGYLELAACTFVGLSVRVSLPKACLSFWTSSYMHLLSPFGHPHTQEGVVVYRALH